METFHEFREGPIYAYVLKRWVQGKNGMMVPDGIRPRLEAAFAELFDRVDSIFSEYERSSVSPN